jgi:adenosine/AMP kinase
MLEFKAVKINKPEDVNIILGQSHFIKTAEDLYEAVMNSTSAAKFGLAFVESSGACKIRTQGNDADLIKIAASNAQEIGAGHSFIICLRNAFPINFLNAIKLIPEVCGIYCASANPVEVIVAQTEMGRGIMGVIDGSKPNGIESDEDKKWRSEFLRKIGYKL